MLNRTNILSVALLLSVTACSSSSGSSNDKGGAGGPNGTGGTSAAAAEGEKFFLPTGAQVDNTANPSVEVDAQGNTHSLYPAYAKGGAYYAFCGAGCTGTDTTKVVKFDTEGTVTNASLALDAQGHPRVLLNAFHKVYFGECDANCGETGSWKINPILDHNGEKEISGEALALDPQGHPRFMMHTYQTYLGVGQKDPVTVWNACDANCTDASSWKSTEMGAELWGNGTLRFDSKGVAHAFVANAIPAVQNVTTGIYYECATGCEKVENWNGAAIAPVFTSETDVVSIHPTLTMALTKAGLPRLSMIARGDDGKRRVIYMECDADCVQAKNWRGIPLSTLDGVDTGLDIALDANDHPRLVYTLDYNIGLWSCDASDCSGDKVWNIVKVEAGSDLPADQIFLNTNCTVGAWFFHSPSLALTSDGHPRVGYQARDMSGGYGHPDTKNSDCAAGTDMTWSRLAILSSVK